MYQTLLKQIEKRKISWVITGIGIFILFTQYIWKFFFIRGKIPGVYWLYYYLDNWYLESMLFFFIAAAVIFVLWIVNTIRKSYGSSILIKIAGGLAFTGIAILITFPAVMAHNTVFIERLEVKGDFYYLSAYPFFSEVNYSLAKCDNAGLFCRTVFYSGDIITGINGFAGHLNYDERNNQLSLIEDDSRVIYSMEIP